MKLTLVIKFTDYVQQSSRVDLILLTIHAGELFLQLDTPQHKFVARENDSKPPKPVPIPRSVPRNPNPKTPRHGDKAKMETTNHCVSFKKPLL